MTYQQSSEVRNICFTVKHLSEQIILQVNENATVQELKRILTPKVRISCEQMCLVFVGKILKDTDTLASQNIKDGLTIHLAVKGEESNVTNETDTSQANSEKWGSSNSSGRLQSSTTGSLASESSSVGSLDFGSDSFKALLQSIQREILGSSELMRQIMDDPTFQLMMNNPNTLSNAIAVNPLIQELVERNNEIRVVLNNPQFLRQTIELARNPSLLQELMRSPNISMFNMDPNPGDNNALRNIYRQTQEPVIVESGEHAAHNPVSGSVFNNAGNGTHGRNLQQCLENRQDLQNRWSTFSTGSGESGNAPMDTTPSGTALPSNTRQSEIPPTGDSSALSPNMRNLLVAMFESRCIPQLLTYPAVQEMMNLIRASPGRALDRLQNDPLVTGNPQLQNAVRDMVPRILGSVQIAGILQGPRLQNELNNQQVFDAIQQMWLNFQQLRTILPNNYMSLLGPPVAAPASSARTPPAQTNNDSHNQNMNSSNDNQNLINLINNTNQHLNDIINNINQHVSNNTNQNATNNDTSENANNSDQNSSSSSNQNSNTSSSGTSSSSSDTASNPSRRCRSRAPVVFFADLLTNMIRSLRHLDSRPEPPTEEEFRSHLEEFAAGLDQVIIPGEGTDHSEFSNSESASTSSGKTASADYESDSSSTENYWSDRGSSD